MSSSFLRDSSVRAALFASLLVSPALAATCQFIGVTQFGGIEPPLAVNADCTDPDYNDKTFVVDITQQQTVKLPDGSTISYTEVKGRFPATRTQAQLPAGVQSPTTASHSVTWRFPDKAHWRNRFFQQTYPLPLDFLNTVDSGFAFSNGGYTVGVTPGSPNVGYRVPAAAAKLAKAYANKLYGNTGRIYGYIYGQSGGSVQMMGANEGTAGVWDGIVPVVIATDGLTAHSFQWDSLYALAVPEAKRQAIAESVAPGTARDIYAGLTSDERDVLNELLNAGFARLALEDMKFAVSGGPGAGAIQTFDAAYEDDFWSKPGYEGSNPPAYLAAAKVDGLAKIASVTRNDQSLPTAVAFDPATVPALGSIGVAGLQFYLYAPDGATRIAQGDARSLSGKLEGSTLTLTGSNDPALLNALVAGGRVRINNRSLLAGCFYPRHSILDNGNPAYNQYRNGDGSPRYAQRPVQTAYVPNVRSSGGLRETGHLKVKTIVIEDLVDPSSYPYVAAFYAGQVMKAMGASRANSMFRVYYNENSGHGAAGVLPGGKIATTAIGIAGILNQALLDLAAWVERGVAPPPSSRYSLDAMNQVVLPEKASERHGLQPLVHLTANGKVRAEVAVNEPVNLQGSVEMPPGTGKVLQYDWYLGRSDFAYEPATKLPEPQPTVSATRTVSFPAPGEYTITLRTFAQRNGTGEVTNPTLLQNLARVRVMVH
ncbi:MAG TPA: PKD domain-containing protein [Candidatus Acidoferrales bacterium]|jgi:hypothetical protein|nr:PKD domain-containing protein [Candidatus Acidoferrales bacterium]